MTDTTLKRREKVREVLSKQGITLREWCFRNGVSRNLVNDIITGRISGRFNKGHRVAVLLGLKGGQNNNE